MEKRRTARKRVKNTLSRIVRFGVASVLMLMLSVSLALLACAEAVPGDADGDGEVTDWDYVLVMRYLAGWNVSLSPRDADVTGDGALTEDDAIRLARFLAGWDVELEPAPDMEHYSVFVAKDGSDETGNGSIKKPFATLEKAKMTVRGILSGDELPEDITVYVREGVYSMDKTFLLTEEDSGTEKCPVTYRSYYGETVELTGAKVIDQTKLYKAGEEITSQIRDENAREHIYAFDLGANGFNYQTAASELIIYRNGETMTQARFPNIDAEDGGYLRIKNSANGTKGTEWEGQMVSAWDEVGNVVKDWAGSCNGVKIDGFFTVDYSHNEGTVKGYDPVENRLIVVATGYDNARFFYKNVLYELDAPGEYYIDDNDDILYLYAYEGMENDLITSAQLTDDVIRLEGADHITLDGITVSGNLKCGVVAEADHFTIKNCEVKNIKDVGISLTGNYGTIFNNHVHQIGNAAVKLDNDWETQEPCHCLICNNHIHDYAQIGKNYNPGIQCYGTCFTVCHNEIHDSAAQAMLAGGNDMVVEYNEMYHVCKESGDAGAIYTGGWDCNDDVFRYNYIHDMMESSGGTPYGIYCDDEGAGKIAYGNLCVNLPGNGLQFGGGQNNQVYNNLMINAGVSYDERAYGWQKPAVDFPAGTLWYRFYLSVRDQYCSRVWSLRYPWTAQMKTTNTSFWPGSYLSVADSFEVGIGYAGVQFRGNAIVLLDNVKSYVPAVFNVMADSRDNYYYDTLEEIGCVDPENGDYSLREDSTVFRDIPGFENIPLDMIGRFEVLSGD